MGYDEDDSMARVDFFKESGKWHTTEAVKWHDYDGEIFEAFRNALRRHTNGRLSGMTAVCLEPPHARPFPLMIRNW